MAKVEYPVTTAIRVLREKQIDFRPHFYRYVEHGGTRVSAEELGVPEHAVVKTLVMETDQRKPLIVLMHGDREVSTKQLARLIGVKSIQPCDQNNSQRYTGYVFGGTSPFGARTPLPVYVQKTVFDLDSIYINGGKRGFLVEIKPTNLRILDPITVDVAIDKGTE
jgi:Cys-tRNA(Pro) deacylase